MLHGPFHWTRSTEKDAGGGVSGVYGGVYTGTGGMYIGTGGTYCGAGGVYAGGDQGEADVGAAVGAGGGDGRGVVRVFSPTRIPMTLLAIVMPAAHFFWSGTLWAPAILSRYWNAGEIV